jgi:hypothetical protein
VENDISRREFGILHCLISLASLLTIIDFKYVSLQAQAWGLQLFLKEVIA